MQTNSSTTASFIFFCGILVFSTIQNKTRQEDVTYSKFNAASKRLNTILKKKVFQRKQR